MRAVLSSFARFHVYQTAAELERLGALEALCTADRKPVPATIAGRVRQFPRLAYYAARGFERVGLGVPERLCFEAFDRWVAGLLARGARPSAPIFHGFSVFSLHSLGAARRRGMVTVVERAGSHIQYELGVVEEERERWGVRAPGRRLRGYEQAAPRMIEEYELTDHILTCSEHSRRTFLARGLPPHKVTSIPLGANFPALEAARRPPERFRVICIGSSFFRKGILDLLRAWDLLGLPDAELAVLTFPPRGLGLGSRPTVRRLAPMPQAELVHEYLRSSLFCLPSLDDGFGMVVLEAMALGVPVVVTSTTGASEVVRPGVDGYVVPPRDPEALAAAILELYRRPDLVAAMGEAASQQARVYSWERYGQALHDWYRAIAPAGTANGAPRGA